MLRLESLEERSMMAITAVDLGAELLITTDTSGANLTLSASNGTLTLTSTTNEINGNPISGGFSTAQYNMADFNTVHVLPGGNDSTIFGSVNIVGSAAFANHQITAGGALVELTGGTLLVNGITLNSQQLGAAIEVDQPIESTGPVNLHPYSGDVILQAPIYAPGQTVSLISGRLQTNHFTVSQTSAGVITADSVYAEGGAGVSLNADNQVSQIAGKVYAYGFLAPTPADVVGDFGFKSVDNLTVATVYAGFPVGNVSGVTTTNGNVTLSSAATNTITVSEAVTASGTGKVLTLYADAFDLDASKAITGENVLLQTLGASADLDLGNTGLTDSELNAINATNLTVRATASILVSSGITLGDTITQLITLNAPAVDAAASISGNPSMGLLRFETESLAVNEAIPQLISAPTVEIDTTSNVEFASSSAGGMNFSAAELATLDETSVGTLRVITTGSISTTTATNFDNGAILKSGGIVALQAGGTISTSAGGTISAAKLSAVGSEVQLVGANSIQSVAGSTTNGSFTVESTTAMSIDTVDVGGRGVGAVGIVAVGASAGIDVSVNSSLTVNKQVKAPGDIDLITTGNSSDITVQHGTAGAVASSGGTTTLDAGRDIFLGTAVGYGDVRGQGLVLNAVGNLVINATTFAESNGAAGLTVSVGGDVRILQSVAAGSILNSNAGGAPVSITTGAGNGVVLDQGSTGGIGANGGNITINADIATLTSGAVSTTATITWETVTTGRSITLGSDVGGNLSFTNTELDLLNSGTLIIGSADAGAIDVTQAVDFDHSSVLLKTGSTVTQAASGAITASSFAVDAVAGINLATATNSVSTLAMTTDSGNISFLNDSGSTLTIGTVAGISGITSDSAATDVTIETANGLNLTAVIQKVGGGQLDTVLLTTTSATSDVSQTAAGQIEAASLGISATGRIELDSAISNVSTLAMSSNTSFGLYFTNDSGGTLTIGTVGSLSGITSSSSSALVGINTADDLAVTQPIGSASHPFFHVGLASIDGRVTQTAAGKIVATTLTILAETDILLDLVANNVASIAFDTDAAGAIEFQNDAATLTVSTASLRNVGNASGIKSDSDETTVSISNTGDIRVTYAIQQSGGGRLDTVELTSTGGDIEQLYFNPAIQGKIEADTLSVQAQANITLDASYNNVLTMAMNTNATGAMTFNNDSSAALSIGAAGSLTGITSDSASSTVTVVTADQLDIDESIETVTGGEFASVDLAATAGDIRQDSTAVIRGTTIAMTAGINIGLDGELYVGLGDATLTSTGVVILTGKLGLTIDSATDYSDVEVDSGSITVTAVDLELAGSYVAQPGEVFTIVAATNVIGTFTGLAEGTELDFNGEPLEVNYTATNITLTRGFDYDFGDAPDTYKTLEASDGPRHQAGSLFLGSIFDTDSDGQPTTAADGDDTHEDADEDGVEFSGMIIAGLNTSITVTASEAGKLDAWIDFNRNGQFEVGEKIFNSFSVVAGVNALSIAIPNILTVGASYARFRLSTAGGLTPTGVAVDGEVEDYAVQLVSPAIKSATLVPDPQDPSKSLLLVNGSAAVDTIIVQPVPGNASQLRVVFPGLILGPFAKSAVDRIEVLGGAGNDSIAVDPSITISATIRGGGGIDTISGGSGNDFLYGDAGNDTIVGGIGADTISGGDGNDVMAGSAGNDIFLGEAGNDRIVGGTDFDRIIEQPGAATISNTQVRVGSSLDTYGQIEQIELTGTTGADAFVFNNLTTNVVIDGRGGNDTVSYIGDGNFVLTNSLLTRAAGLTNATVTMTGITSATLTGGGASNKFTVTDWTRPLTINGGAGVDTIEDAGGSNYVLTPTQLQRPAKPSITISAIENAILTSAAGAVDSKFTLDNWAGSATLTAGAGVDTLAITDNAAAMTLTNTTVTRTGRGAITFNGFEAAELTGGAAANTISGAAYSGKLQIDGKGGNDTLTSGSGTAIVFGGEGNDVLTAGSGPAVLVGGNGNDTLKVGAAPTAGVNAGHAILIGGAGADKLTGGAGEDLLIDSSTDFDLLAADLANLLAHWTAAGTYATRSATLATDLSGQLNPDGVSDTMAGGTAALDLFFANLSGNATVKDKLTDLNKPSTEIINNNF
ncbi:GEVED domain-containing protein [Anatilimnocola sp. NA78]|uniref:GEVED domain-containing protein n=1 Tax=Anatilimnocola sp. NA78 TaxID=3415683 RepID=UPI003CE4EAC0